MTYVKDPLVILTGPTAVGKTALSIKLAQKIGGEIISADSMQVYRDMNIGSAKIKEEEMQGIPHHLIDVLSPDEEFNVYTFQQMAKKSLAEIYKNGHIPIVAGGTGFYIQALLHDVAFEQEEETTHVRKKLEALAEEKGNVYLHELLREKDPVSADEIHENNVKRVIRALEFYELNGFPISLHNKEQREKKSPYNFVYFVLNDEREKLYRRIDARVDMMLKDGLVDEVKHLRDMGYHRDMVSMQGLGYKEILAYLEGEITLDDAIYLIKRDTRHFAKRQLTWFRREKDVIWLNKPEFSYDEDIMLDFMTDMLRKKGIL